MVEGWVKSGPSIVLELFCVYNNTVYVMREVTFTKGKKKFTSGVRNCGTGMDLVGNRFKGRSKVGLEQESEKKDEGPDTVRGTGLHFLNGY